MNIKNYDHKPLPANVFYQGEKFQGDAAFINGFNGYEKSKNDGILCALVNNSCWDGQGNPNFITDEDGNLVHSENRRSAVVAFN